MLKVVGCAFVKAFSQAFLDTSFSILLRWRDTLFCKKRNGKTSKKFAFLMWFFLAVYIIFVILLPLRGPFFHLVFRWSGDSNPRPRTMAQIVSARWSSLNQGASLFFSTSSHFFTNCAKFQILNKYYSAYHGFEQT